MNGQPKVPGSNKLGGGGDAPADMEGEMTITDNQPTGHSRYLSLVQLVEYPKFSVRTLSISVLFKLSLKKRPGRLLKVPLTGNFYFFYERA